MIDKKEVQISAIGHSQEVKMTLSWRLPGEGSICKKALKNSASQEEGRAEGTKAQMEWLAL